MSAFASWLLNRGSSSSSSDGSLSDQQEQISTSHSNVGLENSSSLASTHLASHTTNHHSPSHHHHHHHHHIHFEHKNRHQDEEEEGLMHKFDEEIKSRTCFTRMYGQEDTELFMISTNMQQHPLCNKSLVDNTASFEHGSAPNHDSPTSTTNKRKYQFYRTCAMDYDEVSHTSAALYGDEVCYFPSDYGASLRKLLCCRIVPNKSSSDVTADSGTLNEEKHVLSNISDKAADHAQFPQYNGIKATLGKIAYSAANDVFNENTLLFRSVCTDHTKGKVYLYGGSTYSFERTPTCKFFVMDMKTRHLQNVHIENSEELPQVEGHSLVLRSSNLLYVFGGLIAGSFCNKLFEIDLGKKTCRQIIAQNHDQAVARAYHAAQYLPKFDVMVTVSGKLRPGANAPMTNEILIYHFKENRFQIISDPISPLYSIPAVHVIHSTIVSDHQFAFYGGCKTTNYNRDEDYDPNIFVLTFSKKKPKHSSDLICNLTAINLESRQSSCYTTIVYHKKLKCFVLYGSNASQRSNCLTFVQVDVTSYHDPQECFFNLKSLLSRHHQHPLVDISVYCSV
ncbi:hypothetical protein C9374_012696 [Naegleria lovaniensis]|uniref:Uncharacterized protein n=1 Tax=Naegleria lovaniensis TaxID=51637 RepID=A0AA88GXM5_NAELO|nr:uncharacterized protein C9374_012696 [Naegleria lovaniensis]KAG2392444.1 hypothetical protein C9374_012696 [Naegleria lovaniensis]